MNELGSLYAGQVPQACKKPGERPPRALFLSLSPESRQPLRTLLPPCRHSAHRPRRARKSLHSARTAHRPPPIQSFEPQNLGSPHRHRQSAMRAPLRGAPAPFAYLLLSRLQDENSQIPNTLAYTLTSRLRAMHHLLQWAVAAENSLLVWCFFFLGFEIRAGWDASF